MDTYDFQFLANESERIVLDELELQLAKQSPSLCRCNDCVVDMAALALNNIKPLYRCSLLGSLYAKTVINDSAYKRTVEFAVKDAIKKIGDNPSHGADIIIEAETELA
jgi:competence protein ComFB